MSADRQPEPTTAANWPTSAAVAAAAEAYRRFHTNCFWSSDPRLEITAALVPFVVRGLRENGGHAGYRAAAEILRCR
ncbi:MAG: hypothetical protein FJ100_20205 [Deltaproteobacteria bacterium]|nr:hypothetical protein [Deltaproteobacteria bacterium]